jgi:hypothetical protein
MIITCVLCKKSVNMSVPGSVKEALAVRATPCPESSDGHYWTEPPMVFKGGESYV